MLQNWVLPNTNILELLSNAYFFVINVSFVFQEFFTPIYFVTILAIVRLTTVPKQDPAVPNHPVYNLENSWFPPKVTGVIYVTPDTPNVRPFMDKVVLQFDKSPSLEYFGNSNQSEEAYRLNSSIVAAGIDFEDGSLQSYKYTVRMPFLSIAATDLTSYYTDAGESLFNPN